MCYRTRKQLAADFAISEATVDRIIKEIIRPRIGRRYRGRPIIDIGGRVRVEDKVFLDAISNRDKFRLGLIK